MTFSTLQLLHDEVAEEWREAKESPFKEKTALHTNLSSEPRKKLVELGAATLNFSALFNAQRG